MNIVYFGSTVPEEVKACAMQRGSITTNAATLRERHILQTLNTRINIANIFFVTTAYGDSRGPFWTNTQKRADKTYVLLGYYGKRILKHITSYLFAFFWIMKNLKKGNIVVTYNFPLVYAIPILVKKIFTKFPLIIEFEDFFNKDDIRHFIFGPFEWLGIKTADAFIASSLGMQEHVLNRRKKAKVIVNGGYPQSFPFKVANEKCVNNERIRILYSGTLDKERGIENLLSAFQMNVSNAYELLITGAGPLAEKVIEACHADNRITYLSVLNDEDYHNLISNVDICVNPQWSSISVNFPSKITMYLSYGKLVLSTSISSLTASPYKDLLLFYDENNNQDFWDRLNYVSLNIEKLRTERNARMEIFKIIFNDQQDALVDLVADFATSVKRI